VDGGAIADTSSSASTTVAAVDGREEKKLATRFSWQSSSLKIRFKKAAPSSWASLDLSAKSHRPFLSS